MRRKWNDCKAIRGMVNRNAEHFELYYQEGTEPVALVGRKRPKNFVVQLLLEDVKPKETVQEIKKVVKSEIAFYLLQIRLLPPWDYARYHCGTGSNLYSAVHWLYKKRKRAKKTMS